MHHNAPVSVPAEFNPYAIEWRFNRICATGAAELCGIPNPAFWRAWNQSPEVVRKEGFRPKKDAEGWKVFFYADPAACGLAEVIAPAQGGDAPRILREGSLPLSTESSLKEVSLRELELEVVAVRRKWLSVRYVGSTTEQDCLRSAPLESANVGDRQVLLVRRVCERSTFGANVWLEPVPESEAATTISSGLAELLRRMDSDWRHRYMYRLGSAATLRAWGVASFPEHLAALEKMEQRLQKMPRLDLHVSIPAEMRIHGFVRQYNCVEVVADNIVNGQARVLKNPGCRRVHVPPARLEQLEQVVRDWIAAHPGSGAPQAG